MIAYLGIHVAECVQNPLHLLSIRLDELLGTLCFQQTSSLNAILVYFIIKLFVLHDLEFLVEILVSFENVVNFEKLTPNNTTF